MNPSTERLLRLYQIIGDPKATPPIPAIIPVSRSSWYSGIKTGKYPKGFLIGLRTHVWRASDIYKLTEQA